MISALNNDTPTPPVSRLDARRFSKFTIPASNGTKHAAYDAKPNAALYSKSELLRLYDPICSKILDFLYLGSRYFLLLLLRSFFVLFCEC